MPARLSKLFTDNKEKEVLAEAEAKRTSDDTTAPPPYEFKESSFDPEHAVPPPDITAAFSNLKIRPHDIPTSQECIAHLKVLECFYRLQQKISRIDNLFGISDGVILSLKLEDNDKSELLTKLAEKRWSVYVARAVDRFHSWCKLQFPSSGHPDINTIHVHGMSGELTELDYCRRTEAPLKPFTQDTLPPIDVLLVWHAFMLNPRAYFEDCLRSRRMRMWHHGFPWELVANAINSETFEYKACGKATASFVLTSKHGWTNETDLARKSFECSCRNKLLVDWNTVHPLVLKGNRLNDIAKSVDKMLSDGSGWCDPNFKITCHACSKKWTHDALRVEKFVKDLSTLSKRNIPLPGTLFGVRGIPQRIGDISDPVAWQILERTNAVFKTAVAEVILPLSTSHTMLELKQRIETQLRNVDLMRAARASSLRVSKDERIAIRRVMSRYWQNSSPFNIDLVGAVIRQCSFTEKMHNIDWLHSPALLSTIPRLITKYTRFVSIMAKASHMAVPTLDIDLAWHTHQLRPHSYCRYTVRMTKRFVDHDDKVAEIALNDAFAKTSKRYQQMFGEPYSECTCWYCEAVRESHTSKASRLFNTNLAKANNILHDVDTVSSRSAHISTHNAVRPTDGYDYTRRAESAAVQLEKEYTAACARSRAKGREEPKRNDYYYSEAYGYPVYIPIYAPYVGPLPYTPCLYPAVPGCMAMADGAYGNCCNGTCSSVVAAGGCGTIGNAACAGGSVGGDAGGAACGGCGGSGGCGGCGGGCGG